MTYEARPHRPAAHQGLQRALSSSFSLLFNQIRSILSYLFRTCSILFIAGQEVAYQKASEGLEVAKVAGAMAAEELEPQASSFK